MVWKTIPQAEDDGDIPGTLEISGGSGFTWQADSRLLIDNSGGDPEFYVNVTFRWPVGTWDGNPPRFRITNSSYLASNLNEGWDYLASAWSGSAVNGDPFEYVEFPNLAPPGSGNPVTSSQINVWTPEQFELRPLVDDIDGVSFVYATGDNADFESGAVPFVEQSEWLIEVWVEEAPALIDYNCSCDDGIDIGSEPKKTLAELRKDLLALLGFSAQADNPPPGVARLCNLWLNMGQKFLDEKFSEYFRTRYYQWDLVEGVRFYDFLENKDVCTKKMNPRQVEWVGIKTGADPGMQWQQLVEGIHPLNYSGGIPSARPYLYEFRQCIEVFPAPTSEPGQLVIKGNFGLLRFTQETDKATIDDLAVLLMATYLGKKQYNKPDANDYQAMAISRIQDLNAGNFHTQRFVPGMIQERAEPLPIMKDGYE